MMARRNSIVVTRGRLSGVSLIEVLVSLTVFTINVLAWQAMLHLVLTLLGSMSMLEAQAVEDVPFETLCGSAVMSRWRPRSVNLTTMMVTSAGPRRRGLTLVEVLVALAIAAMILGLLMGSLAMARRSSSTALARSEAIVVRLNLPTLLIDVIQVAGRGRVGRDPTQCGIEIADAGRRLILHHDEHGHTFTDEVFAARDGVGRPALYLRRVPHPRQPWIEDVIGFVVNAVDDFDSGWVRALHVEVEHVAHDGPLRIVVPLLHHPCVNWTSS